MDQIETGPRTRRAGPGRHAAMATVVVTVAGVMVPAIVAVAGLSWVTRSLRAGAHRMMGSGATGGDAMTSRARN